MRKNIFLFCSVLLVTGLFISSCDDDSTGPPPPGGATGSIYITSDPEGASIFVDNNNTNKVTPDSVTGLSLGDHTVRLELEGYMDTTFIVTVVEGQTSPPLIELTAELLTITYGPVRIWETTGTGADQPSGLDLSSGIAYGISGSNVDSVDIYYSSQGFVIRSSEGVNNRATAFFIGSGNNLNDGEDSPLALPSWGISMADTVSRYAFLFDADLHYSKFKIVSRGGGTPGNPESWVEVQWIYNQVANDTRFP